MIELMNNQLTFRFPEVHKKAVCSICLLYTSPSPRDPT